MPMTSKFPILSAVCRLRLSRMSVSFAFPQQRQASTVDRCRHLLDDICSDSWLLRRSVQRFFSEQIRRQFHQDLRLNVREIRGNADADKVSKRDVIVDNDVEEVFIEEDYFEDDAQDEDDDDFVDDDCPSASTIEPDEVAEMLKRERAKNIEIVHCNDPSSPYRFLVVGSPYNERHAQALVEATRRYFCRKYSFGKQNPIKHVNSNGWYILDFHNGAMHIMREDLRDKYNLERVWDDEDVSLEDSDLIPPAVSENEASKPPPKSQNS